uniref:Large ribosomal subunit protein P1 n=1 Tax=Pectinaria gouldii TaxID=260746 RepID=Q1HCM5_PECGU|nr:ribosomal protein P1 [Pectinaria gouldii]
MDSSSEIACVYASLILHDDDVEITADKINAILSAAKVEVEPFWPPLFSKCLEKVDVGSMLACVGAGGGAAAAPAAGGAAPASGDPPAAKEEAKKEESEEESDDDMGFGLFD